MPRFAILKKYSFVIRNERMIDASSITSFCGNLPRYHYRMSSIFSQIFVVLVNRDLSGGSINWPRVWMRQFFPELNSVESTESVEFVEDYF